MQPRLNVEDQRVLSSLLILHPLLHLLCGVVIEWDLLILAIVHQYDCCNCVSICEDEIVQDSLMPEVVTSHIISPTKRIHWIWVQSCYNYLLHQLWVSQNVLRIYGLKAAEDWVSLQFLERVDLIRLRGRLGIDLKEVPELLLIIHRLIKLTFSQLFEAYGENGSNRIRQAYIDVWSSIDCLNSWKPTWRSFLRYHYSSFQCESKRVHQILNS